MASVPTITWNQCVDAGSSYTMSGLTNNTISYGAVEAGNYSKVVCVKPSFNSADTIGNVKFWLQSYQATNDQSSSSVDITDNTARSGWLMKYYVTSNYISLDNVMNKHQAIKTGGDVTSIAGYTASVWGQKISMQPIPMARSAAQTSYPASDTEMEGIYTDKGWGTIAGADFTQAYGGNLQSCNIATTISGGT